MSLFHSKTRRHVINIKKYWLKYYLRKCHVFKSDQWENTADICGQLKNKTETLLNPHLDKAVENLNTNQ